MSINKVILLGRLGKQPELSYTPSQKAVCKFSLATSESWTDKETKKKVEKTEWHNIVTWGNLATTCESYLGKGSQVYVEGKKQTRSWEDKSGKTCYMTEIVADQVRFLDSKEKNKKETRSEQQAQDEPVYTVDDIPF